MKKLLTVLCLCSLPWIFSGPAFPYETSPGGRAYVPKAIWSQAGYGGEWMTDIMIHDINGGAIVKAFFFFDQNYRPGATIWDNSGGGPGVYKATNILFVLGEYFDTGFDYHNRVGGLYVVSQGDSNPIQVSATTYHSNHYSETYNAFPNSYWGTPRDGYSAEVGRPIKLLNLEQGSNRRSNVVVWNPSTEPVTVQFKVIGHRFLESCGLIIIGPPSGYAEVQYGITFTKLFQEVDYQVFNPFTEAGCETSGYCTFPFPGPRTYSYWTYLLITPTAGPGHILAVGATAYNDTQDPATIVPVQVN